MGLVTFWLGLIKLFPFSVHAFVWDLVLFKLYCVFILSLIEFLKDSYTVKHASVVTSFKQSPVLKGHIFLVLSYKISYELNLF
jgi:hypothetical protein